MQKRPLFAAYDPVSGLYRNGLFIKRQPFSARETDVQASILLQTVLALDLAREAKRKVALVEAAFADYSGSVFAGLRFAPSCHRY